MKGKNIMNLVEKLKAIDKKEFEKLETRELPSAQLTKYLGGDETVNVKISAIDGDLFAQLTSTGVDRKGNVDFTKGFSTNAKVVAAAMLDPDLKDAELLKHLGVPTPEEAAKLLFKGELNKIAEQVAELSGFGENDEDEIKN